MDHGASRVQKTAPARLSPLESSPAVAGLDQLTGLSNRKQLKDRLAEVLQQTGTAALICIDLDYFKIVNDVLGHAVGDAVLRSVARRLTETFPELDMVARLGDDEFAILARSADRTQARGIACQASAVLRKACALPPGLKGYHLQASIGIALFPRDADEAELLLRRSNQAMHAAKLAGGNQIEFYQPEWGRSMQDSFDLHLGMRQAIPAGQLRVYLQPKFRLDDLSLVGAEALIRWHHAERGLLTPASFLPAAEQHRVLQDLDAWVVRAALQQLAQWHSAGRWRADWRLALNLVAADLVRPEWLDQLESLLAELALPASCLEFELSESTWVEPVPEVLAAMNRLRQIGASLSIDDFGTGFSSLAYLKRLPIDTIKIDRSFVNALAPDSCDKILIESMVSVADFMGLKIVAEGVETEAQRQMLLQTGCHLGQGFLLSPPVPVEEFATRFLLSEPGASGFSG